MMEERCQMSYGSTLAELVRQQEEPSMTMKLYIYPQNLKATANLWLWSLRDFALICVGLLLSLVALTQMGLLLPLAFTAAFAFLSIRMEDLTVLDYIRFAAKFTISTQQEYRWAEH